MSAITHFQNTSLQTTCQQKKLLTAKIITAVALSALLAFSAIALLCAHGSLHLPVSHTAASSIFGGGAAAALGILVGGVILWQKAIKTTSFPAETGGSIFSRPLEDMVFKDEVPGHAAAVEFMDKATGLLEQLEGLKQPESQKARNACTEQEKALRALPNEVPEDLNKTSERLIEDLEKEIVRLTKKRAEEELLKQETVAGADQEEAPVLHKASPTENSQAKEPGLNATPSVASPTFDELRDRLDEIRDEKWERGKQPEETSTKGAQRHAKQERRKKEKERNAQKLKDLGLDAVTSGGSGAPPSHLTNGMRKQWSVPVKA